MCAQVQQQLSPLNAAFLAAGQEAGFPLTEDVNGFQQHGVSRFEMSVNKGIRNSVSFGYLHSQKENQNLTIWTGCQVLTITMEGTRATGFEVKYQGKVINVFGSREAILSCGGFGSAQLLMLSGIECKVNLPGVGSMRPTSCGSVSLRSANINDPLCIDPNYMATSEDWRVMRESMRLGLEVAKQPASKKYQHHEHTPGVHIRHGAAMDDFIREDAASAYHPCGTCKMGSGDDAINTQRQY